jgi:molybdopterin converting factor small subunit
MKVHLWGELGFYGPGRQSRFEVRLERELPLAHVLHVIGVPEAEIAVFGLNGEVVRLGDPAVTVRDADRLDLFPPSSGGCDRAWSVGTDT